MSAPLVVVLAASFMGVMAAHVTQVTRTPSCCGELRIPIKEKCLNSFAIRNTLLARVNGMDVSVRELFQLLAGERVMLVQNCTKFTHNIICYEDVSGVSEVEVDYQVNPCSKTDSPPNAAAVIQGSLLYLFLTMAVMVMMMSC